MKNKFSYFSTFTYGSLNAVIWATWLYITFKATGDWQLDWTRIATLSPLKTALLLSSFPMIYCFTATFLRYGKTITDFAYRYRFLLAVGFIAFCVLFQISGSSIGVWADYIGHKENDRVILGISRALRSDEWGALTSFTFAQANSSTPFPYISDVVRGGSTDMAMVYAQPIWNFVTLFRPAYYGYLLFGIKGGMAFFWSFRQMFMLLSLFELGMRLTRKNRTLSFTLAILLTYGALTQWWFAVNSIIEMFATGSIAILTIDAYMKTKHYLKRILLALLLVWAGGVYVLSFYPAWQVPLAYIFLILAIYIICDNLKDFQFNWKKDIPIWLFAVFLLILSMAYPFLKSLDTIQSVLNTVYPGNRVSVGRENANFLFDYPMSIFYSITGLTWERGMDLFYDFFPFSTIYGILIYKKTKDKLSLALIALSLFFLLYITVGFPTIVAKASLMSFTTGTRAITAFGVVNILLVIRGLSLKEKVISTKTIPIFILSIITPMFLFAKDYILELLNYGFANTSMLIYSLFLVIATIILFISLYSISRGKEQLLLKVALVIVALSGMMVNPIRVGTDVIDKNPLVEEVRSITTNNPNALWIVDSLDYPRTNVTILAGAPTINSTNTYPNMELWHKLDPGHQYEDIYNRYAHIRIEVTNTVQGDQFELLFPDVFKVQLTPQELKELGITYIVTQRNLDEYSSQDIQFSQIYSNDNYMIYQLIH